MTWVLIALNLVIFFYESALGESQFNQTVLAFGLVPARLSFSSVQVFPWLTLVTSMFLHGSWFHVISNMWFLFIFGDNVEDRMGPSRYLSFYLAAGVIAGLCQFFLYPSSTIPTVGASGAIAGVLGAYFVLYPRARVITLVPLFILPWFVEIPALVYLGIWFLTQLFSGLVNLGPHRRFRFRVVGGATRHGRPALSRLACRRVLALVTRREVSRHLRAHGRASTLPLKVYPGGGTRCS
jgi:membrane associated rhomboid family serine protease